MRSLNKVTLIGNLGKDPEVSVLDGNVAVAKLSLATTETWRDRSGQPQSSTAQRRASPPGPPLRKGEGEPGDYRQ